MMSGAAGGDGGPDGRSRAALKLFVGAGSRTAATGRMLRMVAAARARGVAVVCVSSESGADIVGKPVWLDTTGDAVIEIDRIVALCPAVVVLDDLGRENGEGARHRWRWQDVNDLLDAGIDVLATVDVADVTRTGTPEKRNEPGHPLADPEGNIWVAAVDPNQELVEMVETARQYANNVEVLTTAKALALDTLRMGR